MQLCLTGVCFASLDSLCTFRAKSENSAVRSWVFEIHRFVFSITQCGFVLLPEWDAQFERQVETKWD